MKLTWPLSVCGAFGAAGMIAALAQNSTTPTLPNGTTPYNLTVPAGLPAPPLPSDNRLTVQGVALGQRLFNEKLLSGNKMQACSSCHRPGSAFSDQGNALSKGSTGAKGTRNAPGLFNLAYQHDYFWDGREATLRAQALDPIQNPVEMNQTLANAVANLQKDATYPAQFAKAFGSKGITPGRIGLALEQYELTLFAGSSKFDLVQRKLAKFTPQEQQGFDVFRTPFNPRNGQFGGDCARCHGGPLFSDFKFRNNGLDANPTDAGREGVTKNPRDFATFKTPSLRNLTATGPYMHDGRISTLDEVVGHYSSGIVQSQTLDPGLARENGGVHLNASDHDALVAFLKTLVDSSFTKPIYP